MSPWCTSHYRKNILADLSYMEIPIRFVREWHWRHSMKNMSMCVHILCHVSAKRIFLIAHTFAYSFTRFLAKIIIYNYNYNSLSPSLFLWRSLALFLFLSFYLYLSLSHTCIIFTLKILTVEENKDIHRVQVPPLDNDLFDPTAKIGLTIRA